MLIRRYSTDSIVTCIITRHILSIDLVERFPRNRTILILWDQQPKRILLETFCLFIINSMKSFASVAQTETFSFPKSK